MLMRPLCLLSCLVISACGKAPLAKDAEGKFLVEAKCTPATLTEAVTTSKNATLVVAFGPDSQAVLPAVQAAKRTTRPFVVAIGEAPSADAEIPDAIIVATTGAEAAIDLALLACNGITLPNSQFELGTRTITKANRAAGGERRAAPGDAILAMMRMQHAALLTTDPATDVIHFVGLLQTEPQNDWQAQAIATAATATARYPQLQLVHASKGSEQAPFVEQAKQMIQQGCRAIVVASSNPKQTKQVLAATENAPDGAVPIIVLDPLLQAHDTCSLGCSGNALGKAAATVVQQLLPEGGALITCFTDGEDVAGTLAKSRVQGFCEGMGLPSERLLSR